MIAAVVSTGKATLHELDTVYSVEDCYLMMDVIMTDSFNQRVVNKHYAEKKD